MPITEGVTGGVPVISTCSFSVVTVAGRGGTTAGEVHVAKSQGFSEWDFRVRKHLKNIGELFPCFSLLVEASLSRDPIETISYFFYTVQLDGVGW